MIDKKPHHHFKSGIGEEYLTSEKYKIKIIKHTCSSDVSVVFNDENLTTIHNLRYGNVKKGTVKNPNHKSVYNIGFIGVGEYSHKNNVKAYNTWKGMLERCYDEIFLGKNKTYVNCSVFYDWFNFQNFTEWFNENYIDGFELDKDILIKGNKLYSPKTCSFVPKDINILFTKRDSKRGELPIGVTKHGLKYKASVMRYGDREYIGLFDTPQIAFASYKKRKEEIIKEFANIWKHKLTPNCYNSIMKYEVEITD